MELSACDRLVLLPLNGYWFRALPMRNWQTRLSTEHTKTSSSRFSHASPEVPGYRMLYLGENHQVVMYEVEALLGKPDDPFSNPRSSWVLLSMHVILDNVVDLTETTQQDLIHTNEQELTGRWENFNGVAPTKRLGAALYAVPKLEGVIYGSSKISSRNLLIFPDKLGPRSSIMFLNEISGQFERLT
jgi:RES domain